MTSLNLQSETETNFLRKLTPLVILYTILLTSLVSVSGQENPEEKCEYDINLKDNRMKIVCQGTPAKVSIFATTASVMADDVRTAGGGGAVRPTHFVSVPTGSASPTMNSRRENDIDDMGDIDQDIDDVNVEYPREDQVKDSGKEAHEEAHQPPPPHRHRHGGGATWPDPSAHARSSSSYHTQFSAYVWNATRRLDHAKRQLSTYSDSIINTTTQLHVGDLKLRED